MNELIGTNVKWEYSSSNKTLSFIGEGGLPDYLSFLRGKKNGKAQGESGEQMGTAGGLSKEDWLEIVPWAEHYDEIQQVVGEGINFIAPASFAWMDGLEYAVFPEARFVDNGAFVGCRNLKRIVMPRVSVVGNAAFASCENLRGTEERGFKLALRHIRFISDYAFRGCKSITNISFVRNDIEAPDKSLRAASGSMLEYIGKYAFLDCSGLTEKGIHIGGKASVAYIHETAFPNHKELIDSWR